jgi:hypothetical protein
VAQEEDGAPGLCKRSGSGFTRVHDAKGTLFERGLDLGKRSQLGAHSADREKIMLIVGPVIVEPLTRKWEELRPRISGLMERAFTRFPSRRRARLPLWSVRRERQWARYKHQPVPSPRLRGEG